MASLIEGYNYDIFISYRQKDNKHDGWVTEFVKNLKDELESTFKEEISIYFDINPNDGLLETYDVDESLKEKLKCFIFIPIISRTFCDPKSFAWEHELKAFIEMASKDQFGLKIKLPNGNVVNRVLPVQIHDLDAVDRKLCETCLGTFLRGIEFIYRETGVDRPLTAKDNEDKNLNNTSYRNQINKLALAIKDILSGIQNRKQESEMGIIQSDKSDISIKHRRKGLFAWVSSLLLFLIAVLLFAPKMIHSKEEPGKSIAVLPFVNMSNDPEQEYFCDGIMQEILNNLYMIGDLSIPASTSSMRFQNSKLSVREIAKQLKVKYLLEGMVSRSGNHLRIIIRLIDGETEQLKWSEQYNSIITATDLLNLQSDIARKIASNMKLVIQQSLEDRMSHISTSNTEAYDLYLQARKFNYDLTFKSLLEKALALDSSFSEAYVELAFYYIYNGGHYGTIAREEVLNKANPLITKALKLDYNSARAHFALATLNLYYKWDFNEVEKEYKIMRQLHPSNPENVSWFTDYLLATGRFKEALILQEKAMENNNDDVNSLISMALALMFNDKPADACESIHKAWNIKTDNPDFLLLNTIRVYNNIGNYKEALNLFDNKYHKDDPYFNVPYFLGHVGIAAFKTGNTLRSDTCLKQLLIKSEGSPIDSPCFFTAALYTAMDKKSEAIAMLQKAFTNREVEMYWLKSEPIFKPLHGEPDYEKIISEIGY
jgi:TolB-like protein